jgi:CRP/FNR family cyclic AMP-dependent transcriptional regulator
VKKLTVETIKELFPRAGARHYGKNQIICYQGDKPQHIFFVLKGHIKYYDIDDNGNEKILHIIGPQNIFPMLYAFGVSDEIGNFYSTVDAVEVITVPLDEFHKVINTNIEFSNSLTRWFLTEIEQLVLRINSFEKTDSKLKIMHALKYLAINYGHKEKDWSQVDFAATQQFLADFTGLTRETVSNAMNELEKDGVVRTSTGRKIEIKSKELEKIT